MNLIFLILVFNFSTIYCIKIIWKNNSDLTMEIIQKFYLNKLIRIEVPNFKIIFPGTKWCGQGDIAANDDDLGKFKKTDSCCRAHDKCNDVIESGQTKHNLTNYSSYTRLHCSCDEKFYDCLKGINSLVSIKIGFIYFTILNTLCFNYTYPIIGCSNLRKFPRRKCLENVYDENGLKKYQYIDVPFF